MRLTRAQSLYLAFIIQRMKDDLDRRASVLSDDEWLAEYTAIAGVILVRSLAKVED